MSEIFQQTLIQPVKSSSLNLRVYLFGYPTCSFLPLGHAGMRRTYPAAKCDSERRLKATRADSADHLLATLASTKAPWNSSEIPSGNLT